MVNQINQFNSFRPNWGGDKLLFWYAFFMAFPVITPLFNITIYIFPFLLYSFKKRYGYYFRVTGFIDFIIVLFIFAVIMNVVSVYIEGNKEFLLRAIQVAPNYIYWTLLILFMISHRENLNIPLISKAVFWGITFSILFFFFVRPYKINTFIPFVNVMTQNSFAFLLICFSPMALFYFKNRYGLVFSLLFWIFFSLIGILSGSRASSVLVFIFGLVIVFFERLSLRGIGKLLIIGLLILLIGNSNVIEGIVKQLNPRTYGLLYETKDTFSRDNSYLTRRYQIEKGLTIFKENPIFGIGMNNFYAYSNIDISADFKGAELVKNKKRIKELSAHNSYITILAEGGLLMAIPFVLILLIAFFKIVFNLNRIRGYSTAVVVSFISMLIHLYFITAIVNIYAWFIIGLFSALAQKQNLKFQSPNRVKKIGYEKTVD